MERTISVIYIYLFGFSFLYISNHFPFTNPTPTAVNVICFLHWPKPDPVCINAVFPTLEKKQTMNYCFKQHGDELKRYVKPGTNPNQVFLDKFSLDKFYFLVRTA